MFPEAAPLLGEKRPAGGCEGLRDNGRQGQGPVSADGPVHQQLAVQTAQERRCELLQRLHSQACAVTAGQGGKEDLT